MVKVDLGSWFDADTLMTTSGVAGTTVPVHRDCSAGVVKVNSGPHSAVDARGVRRWCSWDDLSLSIRISVDPHE